MKHITLLSIYFLVLIWSAINPHDYFTWVLEVFPALIGLGILLATKNKFPLTDITYILILVHCCILFVGGHYTYAEVPLFDWIKNTLGKIETTMIKLVTLRKALCLQSLYVKFLSVN